MYDSYLISDLTTELIQFPIPGCVVGVSKRLFCSVFAMDFGGVCNLCQETFGPSDGMVNAGGFVWHEGCFV